MTDYYTKLGIHNSSTSEEIKKAFRKLSLKVHPDKNNSTSNEAFVNICEAYKVLIDPEKRKKYDEDTKMQNTGIQNTGIHQPTIIQQHPEQQYYQHQKQQQQQQQQQHDKLEPSTALYHHPFTDIDLTPIVKSLQLNMSDALKGGLFPIELERCIYYYNGSKKYETVTMYIDVKIGIDDNERIIIEKEGNVYYDNLYNIYKGDIHVTISITNNTDFKRQGLDLIYRKKIHLKEALGGFQFQLNVPTGKVYTISNRKGNIIQPNFKKVINQLGVVRDNRCGNLIIIFDVEIPNNLSHAKIESIVNILS